MGLQVPKLAGAAAAPASHAPITQTPIQASSAQSSSLAGPSAVPTRQAQTAQLPVAASGAQQTDHPMPQAASTQPHLQPGYAAPNLASPVPSLQVSAAGPAVPLAALQEPAISQTHTAEGSLLASVTSPGNSMVSMALSAPHVQQLFLGEAAAGAYAIAEPVPSARLPASVAAPDTNGSSQLQAQPQMSSGTAVAKGTAGIAESHMALASPAQAPMHSSARPSDELLSASIPANSVLSNDKASEKSPPEQAAMNKMASSQSQNHSDAAKAGLSEQNGQLQGASAPAVSCKRPSLASAAPGQNALGQLSAPDTQPAQPASQAGHPGPANSLPSSASASAQLTQAAAHTGQSVQALPLRPSGLCTAQPEQLPASAAAVQRPGSLTKASSVTSMASAVMQQWLGSSPASTVRPAPQQSEYILDSTAHTLKQTRHALLSLFASRHGAPCGCK